MVEGCAAAAESLKSQARQLISAVSVFKVARGDALCDAAAAASYADSERRCPDRAKNMTRPGFGAKVAKTKAAVVTADAAAAKTGTDGEWASS